MTEQRRRSAMTVEGKPGGGKEFEPDPKLDTGRQYEARVIGFSHIGKFEKDVYENGVKTGAKKVAEQCLIEFELTEPDTYVERGPEGNKVKVPRKMIAWETYSSHEKSNLFKISKAVNSDSVWIEDKEGNVDPIMLLGSACLLKVRTSKNGKQSIGEVAECPAKMLELVEPAKNTTYMFGVNLEASQFADCNVNLADVPSWILLRAHDKSLNSDTFKCIDEIEDQIDANKIAKEQASEGRLEGDSKPAKQEEAKAQTSAPSTEAKAEVAPKSSRRTRRGSSTPASDVPDFSAMSADDLNEAMTVLEDKIFDSLEAAGKSADDANDTLDEIGADKSDVEIAIALHEFAAKL